ncbi:MAG: aminodeoxychorismate synthase component I, partial [Desulfobacteraceae bacterium]
DLKNRIETLPRTCMDRDLPDLLLFSPSLVLTLDKRQDRLSLSIPVVAAGDDGDERVNRAHRVKNAFFEKLSGLERSELPLQGEQENPRPSNSDCQECSGHDKERTAGDNEGLVGQAGLTSNFSRAEYLEAVEKIIDYIKAGDIYQVNLSQQFTAPFSQDPFALFLDCFEKNPAPFFAFVNAGDHQVISTSPERFIKRDKEKIETRPIKGTISRGKNFVEDRQNREALLGSVKDDAELSMIVDLMRNDFGRVARHGTVAVKAHKMLEPYDNVFHLVSLVTAELEQNTTVSDLIRAVFPGGSITGCPKIRSMEIIDELESVNRHIYTGSIGYISFHDTMDLSIAIRTATLCDNELWFSVGGGIVFDSDPEQEFQETLDKGATFLRRLALDRSGQKAGAAKVWLNGKIIDHQDAGISPFAPGFQYGAGLFETIRVDNGVPCLLDRHTERFHNSLALLFNQEPFDITWADVIHRVLKENRLKTGTAAVKITAARKSGDTQACQWDLVVSARPYRHRLAASGKTGIDLVTCPEPRQIPTADHKTLNYLYYYLASFHAGKNRADEALVLNVDGTVSETNTCSIMAIHGDTVVVPGSRHVLPGVTQAAALEVMASWGYTPLVKKTTPAEFFSSGRVILTNALMGAVPVLSLDGKKISGPDLSFLCKAINNALFYC